MEEMKVNIGREAPSAVFSTKPLLLSLFVRWFIYSEAGVVLLLALVSHTANKEDSVGVFTFNRGKA